MINRVGGNGNDRGSNGDRGNGGGGDDVAGDADVGVGLSVSLHKMEAVGGSNLVV